MRVIGYECCMMCVKSSEKSVAASEQRHVTLAPKARFNRKMEIQLVLNI